LQRVGDFAEAATMKLRMLMLVSSSLFACSSRKEPDDVIVEVLRTGDDVRSVWTSNEDVFAITSRAILHKNAGGFHTMVKPMALTSVTGTSARDVWVGGEDVVLRYSGASWDMPAALRGRILAIACAAPDDVWIGGDAIESDAGLGELLHAAHGDLRYEHAGIGAVHALWAEGQTVWAAGQHGVARRDRGEWIRLNASARAVWGSRPDDVWIVDDAAVRRWDGARLNEVPLPSGHAPHAIAGTSASDVWIVGAGGMAMHWNGSSWTVVDTGVTAELRSVSVATRAVWIGGDDVLLSLRR
jgi:hypothetical protein